METQQVYRLELDPSKRIPLLKAQLEHHHHHDHSHSHDHGPEPVLPVANIKTHPTKASSGPENGSVYFIGNATTVIEWHGIRILTDPNFLHAGDHVHLGPGVTAERLKNPAVDIDALPPLDCILLSHYHEDHFDKLVEESLNRDFPIISTPHAKQALAGKEDPFKSVYDLDFFQSILLPVVNYKDDTGGKKPVIKVTGMPGKHVPPGPLAAANDLLGAVPPTNGWLIELNYSADGSETRGETGYRIYISGDTLFVDELKEIPRRLKDEKIDLMLVHLGGTTIPGPKLPLLMVTMDAEQGVKLMQLMDPNVTIPVHFDDYSVFLSGLDDFKEAVTNAGLGEKVVYLDRGDQYRFNVQNNKTHIPNHPTMNRLSSRTLYRAIAAPRVTLPTGRIAPLHTSRHLQSTGGYGQSTVSGRSTTGSPGSTSTTSSSPKSSEDASAQSGGSRSKEAVETGSSPTGGKIPNAPEGKNKSSSSSSSGQSNTSTSDSDKFAIPDALANGDARGRTGGGEPLSSSHRSAPPQPKISNASVAGEKPKLTKEQQEEVDEHNRNFESQHGRAEKAEADKVDPKFWGGGGRRLRED
ncbi:Metallo-hydrolase/oxidoreductase [Pseudoneurospora amorphoporcata]|uniref:Metallo-hydrolase/oxidoreductase n=1 Tax=Pseudoneurospora amorphoporcata TaxID=241081 RepID=A0AAN6NP80_9PEZI|nr:Metallo-hydrolase/oxidoreductase [Pseudoneurospora amorphoporcata]